MGQVVGKLNLNKSPQNVENYSLIFAKNIRLLKDNSIHRDGGIKEIPLVDEYTETINDLMVDILIDIKSGFEKEVNKYYSLISEINNSNTSIVNDSAVASIRAIVLGTDFVNSSSEVYSNYTLSLNNNYSTSDVNRETLNNIFTNYNNYKRFPLFNKEFLDTISGDKRGLDTEYAREGDVIITYYDKFLSVANRFSTTETDLYSQCFVNYNNDNVIYQNKTDGVINLTALKVFTTFIVKYGNTIVNALSNSYNVRVSDTALKVYEAKLDYYKQLVSDYEELIKLYSNEDENHVIIPLNYDIVGHISSARSFYLFLKLYDDNHTFYNIVQYNEDTNELTPINANWHWSGGDINGIVVNNLNGDIILNITEYKDDETNIPFKSININKSSIFDDESIYTQTPKLPIINLLFNGYHTTSIPNGVYQFFIRYKIRENYYTAWYPVSKEIFSGTKQEKLTNQGGLSYIDLDNDSGRSFVFTVEHLSNVVQDAKIYSEFQIGFILSHDDESYARSWKHFSIDTNEIYFDYDKAYIEEINIEDLINANFQVYNIQNITTFKDKLYIANYKETDFNPVLQSYADKIEVSINSEKYIHNAIEDPISVTLDTQDANIITEIGTNTVTNIIKSLFTRSDAVSFMTDSFESTGSTKIIKDLNSGIYLKLTKSNIPTDSNYLFTSRTHKHYWQTHLLQDPYGSTFNDVFTWTPFNGWPLRLCADDVNPNGKFIYPNADVINSTTGFAGGYKGTYSYITKHNKSYRDVPDHIVRTAPGPAHQIDIAGLISTSNQIPNVINYIFGNPSTDITLNKLSGELSISHIKCKHFWYVKSVNIVSEFTDTDEKKYVDEAYNNANNEFGDYHLSATDRDWGYGKLYNAEAFEIKFELGFDQEYFNRFDPNANTKKVAAEELVSNITTLLPYQTYKFFVHFMNKNGEITNGYQIGDKDGITISDYPPQYIIYPSFDNITYPDGYLSCFISIQHTKTKIATIFDIEQGDGTIIPSSYILGDCIDLDTRLVASIKNLDIIQNNEVIGLGDYHPSFDATVKELFGASGKIKLTNRGDSSINYAYIKLNYNIAEKDSKLIKCTPFITSSSYNNYRDLNLLGYLCRVTKPLSNYDKYYVDTDIYTKSIENDAVKLTPIESGSDFGTYVVSPSYYVYSNYNLNYISLTLDVIAKVKISDEEHLTDATYAVIAINSMQLSDIYELKAMYKSYTRRYFLTYSDKNITQYDYTIRSTKLESDESNVDIYTFRTLDYYNIPTNKGRITNLVSSGNVILVHTQDTLLKFVGDNTLTKNGGEEVALTENEPFETGITEIFGSNLGYAGLDDRHNSIVTELGYFFYDNKANIIYGYTGQGQLGELSSPIEKIINSFSILDIDFASDFQNDRLFINLLLSDKIDNNYYVTISYNYRKQTFVSLHDFDYDYSISTRSKCYFINSKKLYVVDNDSVGYKGLYKEDKIFPYSIKNAENGICDAIIDVIYNEHYQQIKVIDSIEWICKELEDFAPEWKKIIGRGPNRVTQYKPFMAEDYSNPYSGDKLRIYTDMSSTDLISINDRSNDNSIYDTDSYKKPWFDRGRYIFNYFRNILNLTNTPGYKEDKYTVKPIQTKVSADNQSLIYGKYFVARFVLDNTINFKFENVIFITNEYK